MRNFSKSKKIIVVLLLICLAFTMAGCSTATSLDKDGNYIVDENSTCAKIVGVIIEGLHKGLEYLHLDNYVYAIILLTLLVKVATTPLNVKQQKSMKAMQSVQPKMQEINLKYADDPQKKQEAIGKLYKEENVSPLSGCLPLFIQMPILFILFYGMRNWLPDQSIIDAGLYSFFWIPDLSLTVKLTPYHWLLPILCSLVTFIQQFAGTSNRQDTTQKMMLLMMPVMFLFLTQQFPSALAVYWLFYGLFTMLQMTWLNYRLKTGMFTPKEERVQSKQAIQELAKKQEEKKQKAKEREVARAKHETTHNRSEKYNEVVSNSEGKPQSDNRDKPWH